MREYFNYFGTLVFRKLAGLIGLVVAAYIPIAFIILIGFAEKLSSGEISFGRVLTIALYVELFVIGLIGLFVITCLLIRKSVEWLTE